ncbi:Zn-ribbon domain-containing OB-fold protein [Microbacterium sp. No. 7]|uniref:Zn-ribbon domain-containing OB-fold protein n=1 Tax=Microbacterium sp. No. 7 TaxID=1714373 RepID=UPI0006D1FE4A|nr:OB-fold domain-containing protein [Microbacterium sp. No. 7]ALJ21195.1 hypothetical protein AOA12_15310 [Microbacterium sp. No. 7]
MPGGLTPKPSPETARYWTAAAEGRLELPYCEACARFSFPPTGDCERCGEPDREWRALSGDARLVSYVINYRPLPPAEPVPQVIALVELAEGVRMLSNVLIDDPVPARLPLDAALRVCFEVRGEGDKALSVPVFRIVEEQ